jgi:hypothetical protein
MKTDRNDTEEEGRKGGRKRGRCFTPFCETICEKCPHSLLVFESEVAHEFLLLVFFPMDRTK